MKNKDKFIAALNTLMFSWGSDAPAEAVWAANEMLDWVEAEYNVTIEQRFEEDPEEDTELLFNELKEKLNV